KLLSDNRRPQIFWAINKVVENWTNDLPSTSCCIPPRFGKSDVIRGSALELQEIGAPPSIVVAPWDFLVNQIKDEKKYNEMRARFDIPREAKFATFRRESKLTTDRWWQLEAGAPTLISMTIGLALNSKQQFFGGIQAMSGRYGRRVPIFIDECQTT